MKSILQYIALSFLLLSSFDALPSPDLIDSIDTRSTDTNPELHIRFTFPTQYITHTPVDHGTEIRIKLRINSADMGTEDFLTGEEITWKHNHIIPLRFIRVEYETNTQPVMILHFNKPVSYDRPIQRDSRSLILPLHIEPGGKGVDHDLVDKQPNFALNLLSSQQMFSAGEISKVVISDKEKLYISTSMINEKKWYRLRLGYFATQEEAEQAKSRYITLFPRLWVTMVDDKEKLDAMAVDKQKVDATPGGIRTALPPKQQAADLSPVDALMQEAHGAMTGGNYRAAISLYTKILLLPDHQHLRDAQEFLGLAREKNRQFAHAKAEYEKYLELYPDSEGAERVKQRLVSLITATKTTAPRLKQTKQKSDDDQWMIYGGFSQYYRRDVSITDLNGTSVDQSSIATDIDITARNRDDVYDSRARFTGGYLLDLLDDGKGSNPRISNLYLDTTNKQQKWSARLGRQTRSSDGVLGRFDGIYTGIQWLPKVKLNAIAGFPVDSASDTLLTDRHFYGISANIGTFADSWDFATYIIEQQIDGITDRRAIGGEVRYFNQTSTVLGLLDYDIHFEELNIMMLLGHWRLPNQITFNTTLDYRKSPLLTSRNALQGQSVTTIESMLSTYSETEIRNIAKDRTATSKSITAGLSKPLTQQLQLSADITMSTMSSTRESAGVEAIPGTGNDLFYNIQLIGNSLIKPGDIAIVGLRYSDTDSADTVSLLLNTRYPVNSAWRINPKIRLDYRENHRDNSTQWTTAPSIRTEYIWKRRYRFEAELGGEISDRELTDTTDRTKAYYVNIGCRIDI